MSGGEATSPAYRQAGVDLEAKGPLVRRLARLARTTRIPGVLEGIGGFGGLFSLAEAGLAGEEAVLVATADGVGTKLKLLASAGWHRVAGLDCVAMCVNDLAACGARPLFFLDYLAAGRLDPEVVEAVAEGLAQGCREAGCALLGGETAEMPGMYGEGEYELAGFAVGIAPRDGLFSRDRVRPGDRLIGLASAGLHANGFSLVRRVLQGCDLELDDPAPWGGGGSLAQDLLRPTPLYVRPLAALAAAVEVHAAAHVTGGGLPDNLARILPPGCVARVRRGTWPEPPVFGWLAEAGGIGAGEMFRVFNMGLGMVVAVPPPETEPALALLRASGQPAWEVGQVAEASRPERAGEAAHGSPEVAAGLLRYRPSAKHPEPGGWVEIAG